MQQPWLEECNEYRVIPLVDRAAERSGMTFESVLDVGSSDRPIVDWFLKHKRSREPRRYAAVEIDPVKIAALQTRGLAVITDMATIREPFDLTIAMEVIEHIRPEDSVAFLKQCSAATNKLFALTTPNFEYWTRFRARGEMRECRWIPDHAPDFKPGSSNPHAHQQEMTPENLSAYMAEAFPADSWNFTIYRAWPWQLSDVARNKSFKLFFKLFAVAERLK